MKNKIWIVLVIILINSMLFNCNEIYAATAHCEREHYDLRMFGCRDNYYVGVGDGGYEVSCNDEQSKKSCVTKYETSSWKVCLDSEFTYGNEDRCRKTYTLHGDDTEYSCDDTSYLMMLDLGRVDKPCSYAYRTSSWVECSDRDYKIATSGCRNTYKDDAGQTKACSAEDYLYGWWGCQDKIDPNYKDYNNTGSNWWNMAGSFFAGAAPLSNDALKELENLVKFIGNLVFVTVTVVLGVKYIWGSVESKSDVKESLATLVIAALVFYGYSTLSNLFITGNNLVFINTGSYEFTARQIYSTILYACNFLAVGGLVYVGVKYLMAGAEGKAELKTKGVPLVLGVIMVYATITFLSFILSIL